MDGRGANRNRTAHRNRRTPVKNIGSFVAPLLIMNRPVILKSCIHVADILFRFLGIVDPKFSMPGSVVKLGMFGTLDAIHTGLENQIMLIQGFGVRGNLARRMIASKFRPTQIQTLLTAGLGMTVLQSFDGFRNRAASITFLTIKIASDIKANTTQILRAPTIATKIWSSGSFLYNLALLITFIGGFIATIDARSTEYDLQTLFVVLHIIKAGVIMIKSQLRFLFQRFKYSHNSLKLCPTAANQMERRVNTTLTSYT